MPRVLPDGLDCYIVIQDDYVLGWISKSHYHGKWRAMTPRGKLSHHYTQSAAIEQLVGYGKGQ